VFSDDNDSFKQLAERRDMHFTLYVLPKIVGIKKSVEYDCSITKAGTGKCNSERVKCFGSIKDTYSAEASLSHIFIIIIIIIIIVKG
jgi:hypothetical protein